jgi:hypothetical protein
MPTEIPVFRPEITIYRKGPDGEWDEVHCGTITNTLFRPMPDEDRLTEAGLRRVVRLGSEPFFRVLIPQGAVLVAKGRATMLQMPNGKVYDAITALAYAKMREVGLDLVRPRPCLAGVEIVIPIITDPRAEVAAFLASIPKPIVREKRTVQLSMFGD